MKKYMRKIALVLAVVMMLALACEGALAAAYSAKVLTSEMDVYVSPTDAEPAAQLKQATSFYVTGVSGEWARISYKGRTGYAQMQNIMFDNSIAGYAVRDTEILFITKNSYQSRVSYRGSIAAGTRVYVRGISHGYLLVTNASGSILGFVHQSDFARG